MIQSFIYCVEIFLDKCEATCPVGILDRTLDGSDRIVSLQDTADRKEARLEYGVNATAQSGFSGYSISIYDKKMHLLVDDFLLHSAGKMIPHLIGTVGAVQQERSSGLG